MELPDGRTIAWRELARELLAARTTGTALALPLLLDAHGRKLVDYTPPHGVAGATPLFDWKRDLDQEIWKALEVPPEILEANRVGSGFSGRSIPFVVALSAVQMELNEIVRCVDRDILRPLARLNFGGEPRYELHATPLVEAYDASLAHALASHAG